MNNCSKCGNPFPETTISFGMCERCRIGEENFYNPANWGFVTDNDGSIVLLYIQPQVRETVEDYLL